MAIGEVVGFINSDDFYHRKNIISTIATALQANDINAVYGDVSFVARADPSQLSRYYSSKNFTPSRFRFGFLPAHPTFFTFKRFYDEWGYFNPKYKISGDFELMMRFMLINKLKCKYIPLDFVTMRVGGVSTKSPMSTLRLNKEISQACKENGIFTCYPMIYLKYVVKIFQWAPFVNLKKDLH